MKLVFDSQLDYQHRAMEAVVGLFKGQSVAHGDFTITQEHGPQGTLDLAGADWSTGVGNRLELSREQVQQNLQRVQMASRLVPTEHLAENDYNFDIEMETGTGKTYVYLRSMFELNKRYGMTKFIVVVPSTAIREGVNKSIEIMRDHFAMLYNNMPFHHFVYDGSKREQVKGFATDPELQIMIITIQSFNTDQGENANLMFQDCEALNGYRPIDLIRETRPIVIVDEPQSVDNTETGLRAIENLHPLAVFRYSATHRRHHHKIFSLDAVDAHELGLVKSIYVTGHTVEGMHNTPYVLLKRVNMKSSPVKATLELDIQTRTGISRKSKQVRVGDDLVDITKRTLYEGFVVDNFGVEDGGWISFTNGMRLQVDVPTTMGIEDRLKEGQIAQTIRRHLEKMWEMKPHGVKVLSLFFIDRVANYRQYDEEGNPQKGKYAEMFERQFIRLANLPQFRGLFAGRNIEELAKVIHDGYFAQDKRGAFKESRKRETAADRDAYALIMRDKEKLLSMDEDLAFIFSHTALREGWDNPNVFQICTLNETTSEIKKRQEIGRGLRLCVNQKGERVQARELNRLSVIANGSYEDFCKKLQTELRRMVLSSVGCGRRVLRIWRIRSRLVLA